MMTTARTGFGDGAFVTTAAAFWTTALTIAACASTSTSAPTPEDYCERAFFELSCPHWTSKAACLDELAKAASERAAKGCSSESDAVVACIHDARACTAATCGAEDKALKTCMGVPSNSTPDSGPLGTECAALRRCCTRQPGTLRAACELLVSTETEAGCVRARGTFC